MSSVQLDGAAPCPVDSANHDSSSAIENSNGVTQSVPVDPFVIPLATEFSDNSNNRILASGPSSSLREPRQEEEAASNNNTSSNEKENNRSPPRVTFGHVSNGTTSPSRADALDEGLPVIICKDDNDGPSKQNHNNRTTQPPPSQVEKPSERENTVDTMKSEELLSRAAFEEHARPSSDPDGACDRTMSQVFSSTFLSKILNSSARFEGEPELETVHELPASPPTSPSVGSMSTLEQDSILKLTLGIDATSSSQMNMQSRADSDISDDEATSDYPAVPREEPTALSPKLQSRDFLGIEHLGRSTDATSQPNADRYATHRRDPSAAQSSAPGGFLTPPPTMQQIPTEVDAGMTPRMSILEGDLSVHSGSVRQDAILYSHGNGYGVEGMSMQQHPLLVVQGIHRASAPTSAAPFPGYAMHSFQSMHPQTSLMMGGGGKRRIHLRLAEDVPQPVDRRTLFGSFRRPSRRSFTFPTKTQMSDFNSQSIELQSIDRGSMTVSWYEGTTSLELQEHVRTSLIRKLALKGTVKLDHFRILDETAHPAEEIVLSPYIPDGSKFLLRFSTRDADGDSSPVGPMDPRYQHRMLHIGPPDSPSAAPSAFASSSELGSLGLNANQLAMLGARLNALQVPSVSDFDSKGRRRSERKSLGPVQTTSPPPPPKDDAVEQLDDGELQSEYGVRKIDDDAQSKTSYMETASLHPEDPIEARLRQITELLIAERTPKPYYPRQQKRDVIFVLANYFVLFLSLIAISAEIQARAPAWNKEIEKQFQNVHRCSADQDALFECVSNGDFAGLVASVVLWISRSAATKRIFLFGFESPQKLWNVVYESLVTALCWGFSYMFIRRGLNPDTNQNFIQKYWKDAVYGSLAGFNAAFLKHVLKNLIPQEAIEDAFQERQLKILSWLPSFAHH